MGQHAVAVGQFHAPRPVGERLDRHASQRPVFARVLVEAIDHGEAHHEIRRVEERAPAQHARQIAVGELFGDRAVGHPERFRIITFEGAFHGRTLATLAAGGQQKYLEGFGPKVEGFDQVPFADHEALKTNRHRFLFDEFES